MMHVSFRLTMDDVELLSKLVAEQLFRREFFDPRQTGRPVDLAELAHGKKLLERLRRAREQAKRTTAHGGNPEDN